MRDPNQPSMRERLSGRVPGGPERTRGTAEGTAASARDAAAMQQRLMQLHRTLGLSDNTGSAPGGSAAPAVDVLASLSAKAGRAQSRQRPSLGWWLALPLLGLALWWAMTDRFDPAPTPLPPPSLASGAETVAAAAAVPAAVASVPPVPPATPDAGLATQTDPGNARALPATAAPSEPSAPSTSTSAPAANVDVSEAPSAAAGPVVPADPANIRADTDTHAALRSTLESWRQAWAARDVQAYLGHYAHAFVPANGQPKAQWAANRRRTISSRSAIVLSLSQIELKSAGPDRWQARFLQDYASDGYVEKQLPKTLDLVREDGQWRLAAERSGTP